MPPVTNQEINSTTVKAIAFALNTKRDQVIGLLKKHGVAIDSTYTDNEVITALLIALGQSKRFATDLKSTILGTVDEAQRDGFRFTGEKDFFGFTGEKDFFYTADGETRTGPGGNTEYSYRGTWVDATSWNRIQKGTQNTLQATKDKTAVGSFLAGNLGTIVGTGLTTLSTLVTNKSNKELALIAKQIEEEKTKQAMLLGQAGTGTGAARTGISTGAKVAIGVGVAAVIGTIIYFVVKKKK